MFLSEWREFLSFGALPRRKKKKYLTARVSIIGRGSKSITQQVFLTMMMRFTIVTQPHRSLNTDTLSDENLMMAGIGRNM